MAPQHQAAVQLAAFSEGHHGPHARPGTGNQVLRHFVGEGARNGQGKNDVGVDGHGDVQVYGAGSARNGERSGLSLLLVLNFNHRGTENTEHTDGGVLLGWKEATEAAFGREIDSIHSPRIRRTSVFSPASGMKHVPLW